MHVTLNIQLLKNMDHPNHEIKLARISVAFGPDPPNDPYVTSHCQPPPLPPPKLMKPALSQLQLLKS